MVGMPLLVVGWRPGARRGGAAGGAKWEKKQTQLTLLQGERCGRWWHSGGGGGRYGTANYMIKEHSPPPGTSCCEDKHMRMK